MPQERMSAAEYLAMYGQRMRRERERKDERKEPRPVRASSAHPSEHDEQAALFQWAEAMAPRRPELHNLFAIPNGGHRSKAVAGKLKAEGVKPGVPDTMLAVAREPFHGLYVEMKSTTGATSKDQRDWHERLKAQGYKVCVCFSFEQARKAIETYLDLQED